jgi:anaerobic magnesium-protoporphyrin IX monomethyl ester cyclase
MRVALIYAPWLEERASTEDVEHPPIGLWYVAAAAKAAGHDVTVCDWHSLGRSPAKVEAALREMAPDALGFSVLMANRHGALDIARRAKALLPNAVTVFGGPAPTFMWDSFLTRHPQVDYVIRGEGELPFVALLERLASGDPERADLPALAWRRDGKPTANPCPPPVEDLDSLPDPAEHFSFRHVVLSRGCPGKCTFCGSPRFWGGRVRSHSPEYFVTQMQRLVEQGATHLYVSDDTFTADKQRVRRVCELIAERGLKVEWNAISRVDAVDQETLTLMRRAGCIQVSFGVESGSDKVRRLLNKRFTAGQAEAAFAAAHRAGLLARAYFIYGTPKDSEASIRDNLALIRRLKPLVVHFFVLTLYPGSALFDRYREQFSIPDSVWDQPMEDLKYFELDPGLPQRKVAEWGRAMKAEHFRLIPQFAQNLELDEDPSLAPLHAEFLNRLAQTFLQGDFAANPAIPDKHKTAALLLERSLRLSPTAEAYRALGALLQEHKRYMESGHILATGHLRFPQDAQLAMALAVSLMNQGHFAAALTYLRPLSRLPQALHLSAVCLHHSGDPEAAKEIMRGLGVEGGP